MFSIVAHPCDLKLLAQFIDWRKCAFEALWHLVSRSVGRHAQRLVVVAYGVLNIRFVGRLAENDTHGGVLMASVFRANAVSGIVAAKLLGIAPR